jgi:hypothetical protein
MDVIFSVMAFAAAIWGSFFLTMLQIRMMLGPSPLDADRDEEEAGFAPAAPRPIIQGYLLRREPLLLLEYHPSSGRRRPKRRPTSRPRQKR